MVTRGSRFMGTTNAGAEGERRNMQIILVLTILDRPTDLRSKITAELKAAMKVTPSRTSRPLFVWVDLPDRQKILQGQRHCA